MKNSAIDNTIKAGDIFITKLERDFYGAFKILKRGKLEIMEDDHDYLLVALLDIIDKEKPKLSDPRLNNILCANRFNCNNDLLVGIYVADPKYNKIKNYEYLGNLPLTETETKLPLKLGYHMFGLDEEYIGFPLVGVLSSTYGDDAFYEWRWKYEKEAFIEDVEGNRRRTQKNRSIKPKEMLTGSISPDM